MSDMILKSWEIILISNAIFFMLNICIFCIWYVLHKNKFLIILMEINFLKNWIPKMYYLLKFGIV